MKVWAVIYRENWEPDQYLRFFDSEDKASIYKNRQEDNREWKEDIHSWWFDIEEIGIH